MPDIVFLCEFRQFQCGMKKHVWGQLLGVGHEMWVRSEHVYGFAFYHKIHLIFQSLGTINLAIMLPEMGSFRCQLGYVIGLSYSNSNLGAALRYFVDVVNIYDQFSFFFRSQCQHLLIIFFH